MTVPMARTPNRVVGRSLSHFLGLGMHCGYFVLEQLQYDFAATVVALDQGNLARPDEPETRILKEISRQLRVSEWIDHGAELLKLEAEFAKELEAGKDW